MAELLGLIASVLQLVDTVAKACAYIHDFRNARTDQKTLLVEIENLQPLITDIHGRIAAGRAAGSVLENVEKPLMNLKTTMEKLAKKLEPSGSQKFTTRFTWSLWGKDEVAHAMESIERCKSSLNVYLGVDIWDSAQATALTVERISKTQKIHHLSISSAVEDAAQERKINHKKMVQSVENLGVEMLSSVKDVADEHRRGHNVLSESLTTLVRNQGAAGRDMIIEWYSPLNFFLRQADIFSSHQSGTGQWFLDHYLFNKWKLGSQEVLWCPGMPGAGKTVIASIAVHQLRAESNENVGVAAIYLNHKESDGHSPSRLLASLWRQLVFRKPISPDVQKLYELHYELRTRPTIDEDLVVLRSVISEYSRVFLVVDALDEYPEEQRHVLLRHLLRLGPTVSLMLTSRPHIMIDHFASKASTLEIRATAEDIRQYLEGKIENSPRMSKHLEKSPDLQEAIEGKIVQRSDGMFLLAKLHIDTLTAKQTIKSVRDALKSMPNDLEHAYDDVVGRINRQSEDDKKLAWVVLSWITNAKRPLRPTELQEALAVEPGTTELDPENVREMDTILSVCAGLVVINEEDNTIRLIHYTMQDYLERIQSREFPDAPAHITLACMTYLSFKFPPQYNVHWRTETHPPGNPFLPYAVEFGLAHARGDTEVEFQSSILSFLRSHTEWWKWWIWLQPRWLLQQPPPTPLWIAAAFDLEYLCRRLIDEDPHHAARTLQNAVLWGIPYVIPSLVHCGADVNFLGEYGTVLHIAAMRGHKDILELLLNNGADMRVQDSRGSPLQMAAQFLLERDDVGHRTRHHKHCGHADFGLFRGQTSFRSTRSVIQLLIERGAVIDNSVLEVILLDGEKDLIFCALAQFKKTDGVLNFKHADAALQIAALFGRRWIVGWLVSSDADVNADVGHYGTPLYAAAVRGDPSMVRLFLRKGATVNAEPGENGTILQAATAGGHVEVVRLLLENGAEVNAKSRRYFTALRAAATHGHAAICQLLISHGAELDAYDERFGTALRSAVLEGHLDIVRLLLTAGADANPPQTIYSTPLQAAAFHGEETIVSTLLAHGADVNAPPQMYGTALQAATRKGHLKIVSMLLAAGGPRGMALEMAFDLFPSKPREEFKPYRDPPLATLNKMIDVEEIVDASAQYIVELISEITSTPKRSWSRTQFVGFVLSEIKPFSSTILVTLTYISRARSAGSVSADVEAGVLQGVFLGALICASKYTNNFKAGVALMNLNLGKGTGSFWSREVERIERDFLNALGWDLHVSEEDILTQCDELFKAMSLPASYSPTTSDSLPAAIENPSLY